MKLLRDKSGNMLILTLFILMFLFTFSGIVGEIFRLNSIQGHVEYELQRAVNIAVEEAMHDTWRQDKFIKLDTAQAEADFYAYLHDDLGLDSHLKMIRDGVVFYTLSLETLDSSYDPPRLMVKGRAITKSAFPFLTGDVEIPFQIASRNVRLDE